MWDAVLLWVGDWVSMALGVGVGGVGVDGGVWGWMYMWMGDVFVWNEDGGVQCGRMDWW